MHKRSEKTFIVHRHKPLSLIITAPPASDNKVTDNITRTFAVTPGPPLHLRLASISFGWCAGGAPTEIRLAAPPIVDGRHHAGWPKKVNFTNDQ